MTKLHLHAWILFKVSKILQNFEEVNGIFGWTNKDRKTSLGLVLTILDGVLRSSWEGSGKEMIDNPDGKGQERKGREIVLSKELGILGLKKRDIMRTDLR